MTFMDFRSASDQLDKGETSQDEITEQILSLPCVYGIFQTQSKIFCIQVFNRQSNSEITLALLFSNLKVAIEAVNQFKVPTNWYIAQWSEVEESLQSCLDIEIDGVAFDSLPDGDTLTGLIIDKDSIRELIWLAVAQEQG